MAAPLHPCRCEAFELEAGLWSTSAVDLCRPKEAFAAFVDEKKCQAAVELVMDWMGDEGSLVIGHLPPNILVFPLVIIKYGLSFAHGFSFKNMLRKMLNPLRTDILTMARQWLP